MSRSVKLAKKGLVDIYPYGIIKVVDRLKVCNIPNVRYVCTEFDYYNGIEQSIDIYEGGEGYSVEFYAVVD